MFWSQYVLQNTMINRSSVCRMPSRDNLWGFYSIFFKNCDNGNWTEGENHKDINTCISSADSFKVGEKQKLYTNSNNL